MDAMGHGRLCDCVSFCCLRSCFGSGCFVDLHSMIYQDGSRSAVHVCITSEVCVKSRGPCAMSKACFPNGVLRGGRLFCFAFQLVHVGLGHFVAMFSTRHVNFPGGLTYDVLHVFSGSHFPTRRC